MTMMIRNVIQSTFKIWKMKNKAMFYKNVLKLIDNSFNYFFADKESTVCSFTTQYM